VSQCVALCCVLYNVILLYGLSLLLSGHVSLFIPLLFSLSLSHTHTHTYTYFSLLFSIFSHRDKQSSKRKAKYESDLDSSICSQTMSSSTSSSSSRRKTCNSRCPLENIIQNGKNENLKKLRDCLNRYEKSSRPTTGLVIAYDPLTEAGVVLYHWLTDLGFTASLHNDHSVVQLPASAVSS
jgi:hypothetical protein